MKNLWTTVWECINLNAYIVVQVHQKVSILWNPKIHIMFTKYNKWFQFWSIQPHIPVTSELDYYLPPKLGLFCDLLHTRFSQLKLAPLPMHAICPPHLNFPHLINLKILYEKYKLWNSIRCNFIYPLAIVCLKSKYCPLYFIFIHPQYTKQYKTPYDLTKR